MPTARTTVPVCATVLGLALVAGPAVPASAASAAAVWSMNEGSGARKMNDSSPRNNDGSIGGSVRTGVRVGGATGYLFSGSPGVRNSGRLVTVRDAPSLDPGGDRYAVTVRLRTRGGQSNIVQKGQSGTRGGFFKIELHNGRPKCVFRGSNRSVAIGWPTAINNNAWHTVRCERSSRGVTVKVDSGRARTAKVWTGSIGNAAPVVIGGKSWCNPPKVGCDYFSGAVDYVRIDRG